MKKFLLLTLVAIGSLTALADDANTVEIKNFDGAGGVLKFESNSQINCFQEANTAAGKMMVKNRLDTLVWVDQIESVIPYSPNNNRGEVNYTAVVNTPNEQGTWIHQKVSLQGSMDHGCQISVGLIGSEWTTN